MDSLSVPLLANKGEQAKAPFFATNGRSQVENEGSHAQVCANLSEIDILQASAGGDSPGAETRGERQQGMESVSANEHEEWLQPSMGVVKSALLALCLYLAVGCVIYHWFHDDIKGARTCFIVDSMYFSIVTMTTVGYGDLVPSTRSAELCVCFLIFLGIANGYLLFSTAMMYISDKQAAFVSRAITKHAQLTSSSQGTEGSGDLEVASNASSIVHSIWFKGALSLATCLFLLVVGMWALEYYESMDPVKAFYCAFVSMTTVGYGELSFNTLQGRIFACCWLLGSSAFVGIFFYHSAEAHIQFRNRRLIKHIISQSPTRRDLQSADFDKDQRLSCSEFVLLKLRETGKVAEADIEEIAATFEDLDKDGSGYLEADELHDDSAPRPKPDIISI